MLSFYFISPSVKCGWWPLAIYILSVEICWYRNSRRSNCFCSYVSSVPQQIACILKMFPSGIASCYWWVDPRASLISRACTRSVACFWGNTAVVHLSWSEQHLAAEWVSSSHAVTVSTFEVASASLTLANITLTSSIILWLMTWIDTCSIWVLFLLVLWTLDGQIF